jgi:hypothetical protein
MREFTILEELTYEGVKARGHRAVAKFHELLGKGESVNIAAMLATQTPPGLGLSDQTYMRNKKGLLEQFDGNQGMLDLYNRNYRAQTGEDIPGDAFVFRGLATEPGDREVIMTHKHTLADVQRAMQRRNVTIHGDFDQTPVPQRPRPQVVRMREDILEAYVDDVIATNPERAEEDRRDLREEVLHDKAPVIDDSCLTPLGASDKEQLMDKTFGKSPTKKK